MMARLALGNQIVVAGSIDFSLRHTQSACRQIKETTVHPLDNPKPSTRKFTWSLIDLSLTYVRPPRDVDLVTC